MRRDGGVSEPSMPKSVVLVSGGLDSATVLAIAGRSFDCHALSFDYGQRHAAELGAARRICTAARIVDHQIFPIALSRFGGSALTDARLPVPDAPTSGIP